MEKRSPFQKASRKAKPLSVYITGVTGSGKTTSAIRLAIGLAGDRGRVVLIDGEGGAANWYGDDYDFDIAQVGPEPRAVLAMLHQAVEEGYPVVIWEGAAKEWEYIKEKVDKLNDIKDQFGNWAKVRKAEGHEELLEFIEFTPVDLIVTIHSEEYWGVVQGPDGRNTMRAFPAAPVQCKQFRRDFVLGFTLEGSEHLATLQQKNRVGLWQDNVPFLITEETGETLRKWRDEGAKFVPPITEGTKRKLRKAYKALGWTDEPFVRSAHLLVEVGAEDIGRLSELTEEQGKTLYELLKKEYKETKDDD